LGVNYSNELIACGVRDAYLNSLDAETISITHKTRKPRTAKLATIEQYEFLLRHGRIDALRDRLAKDYHCHVTAESKHWDSVSGLGDALDVYHRSMIAYHDRLANHALRACSMLPDNK
jgi:hypothetical protein